MLDFSTKNYIRADLWSTANAKADYLYRTGSPLVPEADQPGWYRVPFERAPEKYAYMYHELTPTAGATSITVTLRGLDLFTSDEDWRWSLAAVDGAGNVRYSNVWAPGTQTFALNPGENKVLLVVVATPGNAAEDLDSFYNTKAVDKNADRLRYPYEVQINGATPTVEPLNWNPTGSFHYYTNPDGSPGGLIENTATVATTAYIGPNAKVLGTSQVLNNAKVLDYAVIANNARIRNNAVVSGYAVVRNNGIVQDNALVTDHAIVENNAQVQASAVVEQYARLGDSAIIRGQAIARGDSYLWGSGSTAANLSGYAIADYDYSMNYSDISDGNQFNHIPFDNYFDAYYAQTQKKPRGLIASYRVEETSGEVLWDEFGSQEAWLRGSPGRVSDSFFNGSQVLSLNGASQYAVLDRTLANVTDATFAVWLNPTSADADETLLYFGSSPNSYLKLTGRAANGFAHLTISVNGLVKELSANIATPLNQWTHLALTFGSGTVSFYINGQSAGSASISYRPIDVLGPDTYAAANPFYLGRDPAGNYFTGRLEDIRFYNATLSQAEIKNEISRAGAKIGEFYATSPVTFNGSSTTAESGVHNGATRTLVAWINPKSSDDVASYEPIFDSDDERTTSTNGSGIGLDAGIIKVRLDGVGIWNTGVPATLNTWQQVAVSFNGGTATLYVNGVQRATRTYSGTTPTGKNFRIGYGQTGTDATTTRTFFDGQIFDAQIYDRAIVPNASLGTPTAQNDSAVVAPNSSALSINVLANDSHPSPIATLKVNSISTAAHGTVAIGVGATTVTYSPAANFSGSDTFTYTISDGFGGTATATVLISVKSTLLGDFNQDSRFTGDDLQGMLAAMADLRTFQANHNLADADLIAIGDLNGDQVVTNADLQALINRLMQGTGAAASATPTVNTHTVIVSAPAAKTELPINLHARRFFGPLPRRVTLWAGLFDVGDRLL